MNKQRMEKKAHDRGEKSGINEKKIRLLEQAGFVWAKRKGQAAWEEKFLELQSYLERFGHCRFHLGCDCLLPRNMFDVPSDVVTVRIMSLNSYLISFPHFYKLHAGNVPTKNRDNRALGRWVSTQRSMFKKFQEGDINDIEVWNRRIRRLNGINFSWSLAPSGPPGGEAGEMRHRGDDDDEARCFNEEAHVEVAEGQESDDLDESDGCGMDADEHYSEEV